MLIGLIFLAHFISLNKVKNLIDCHWLRTFIKIFRLYGKFSNQVGTSLWCGRNLHPLTEIGFKYLPKVSVEKSPMS